jgi:hypothetical protein
VPAVSATGFTPSLRLATAKPSGSSTKTSSVAMASGVTATMPSVRASNFRCMKYAATSVALPSASAQSRTPLVNFPNGRKTTISSATVRIARYQKIAM